MFKYDFKYDFHVKPSPVETTSETYDVEHVFEQDFHVGPSPVEITSEHGMFNMLLNMISK